MSSSSIMESLRTALSVPELKQRNVVSVNGEMMGSSSSSKHGAIDMVQFLATTKPETKDPFFVMDVGVLVKLWEKWVNALPNIHPFYAVKCNPGPAMIAALAALGAGFDCASPAEIDAVLAAGVSPDRIIYANPCKDEDHVEYSARLGINLTTIDSVEEVRKLRKCHPKTAALLRIKVDDSSANVPFGVKYGALLPEEVDGILETAVAAGINVSGVSFHIGTGASHGKAFASAIASAKLVFDRALQLGLPPMHVLDLGGGFTAGEQFDDAAATIASALELHFADDVPDLTLIAEPGRYFAQTVFSEATRVIGKRVRGGGIEYWVNDGIYGSMLCIIHEGITLTASPLACKSRPENPTCEGMETYVSTVFGPTCSGLDRVVRHGSRRFDPDDHRGDFGSVSLLPSVFLQNRRSRSLVSGFGHEGVGVNLREN
ncbi:hypothetical protein H6P81_015529 [Aristolochia fimbriata]|uniref:ornithine decarboxylase n=1 Tax=Aristolochia fimbriata TaxID=158543 RepID=A0AAV7E7N1_ARIFI|nr:hypothetical protein H6P81_015529 [Aristolochia fimbriata]